MRGVLLAILLGLGVQAPPKAIAPVEAGKHVGEAVTVQGVVTSVTVSPETHTTVLDFGRPVYPSRVFRAVIPDSVANRFPNVKAVAGKTVLVRGTVRLHNKKPEILLLSPEQLNVVV